MALAHLLWTGPESRPPPWRTWRRLPPRVVAAAVAVYGLVVVVAAAGQANATGRMPGSRFLLLALPLVAGLVLLVWRPLGGWRLVTLWTVLTPLLLAPPVTGVPLPAPSAPATGVPLLEPWQWCLWCPALFAATWASPPRRAARIAAVSGVALVVLVVSSPWPLSPTSTGPALWAFALPLAAGTALGARWSTGRVLARERARTATAQAERGALVERARIAREMHDVVAHDLSLLVVRCETAPYRLASLPPDARAELADVAEGARRALVEVQRLLGVLRSGDQAVELAPQPGLADLDPLFAATRATGTPLDVDVRPPPAADAALGLAVHRIVAQALANAAQHAAGAPVRVEVVPHGRLLRVRVVSGPGRSTGVRGAGVGLIGVRERAELRGGRFSAGRTAGGGFEVVAELPLREVRG